LRTNFTNGNKALAIDYYSGAEASKTKIDFWAVPVLFKRTGWDFLRNLATIQSCPIPQKNPVIVKNE
jgi:hypothetical protein